MSETYLPHEFQYSSARHQADSAISGMWLFLATEVLFFGALFLTWIYARHWNQAGFDAGARQTNPRDRHDQHRDSPGQQLYLQRGCRLH